MATKDLEKLGPIMSAIAQEGARIVGSDPDGLYIYIYIEIDGYYSVYGAVFKDEGSQVRYYDPTANLNDLVCQAWDLDDGDMSKRWLVMEYEVNGGQFDAHFTYKEEINPDDYATHRRRAALKKRYGDKPVIYPPIPENFIKVT